MKSRLLNQAASSRRSLRARVSAALILLGALAMFGGCGYDAATGPDELNADLFRLRAATLYLTQKEVLNVLADELDGRRIRLVLSGTEIDTGLLPDYEYGRTEFESVASSFLADVRSRLEGLGSLDDASLDLLSGQIMAQLADEGPILGQLEAILIPLLYSEFGRLDSDGSLSDCNKVRLDDIGAVSIAIKNVSLVRDGAELSLHFDLADLVIEVERARAWVPTLWCNVFTINDCDISYPGTVLSVTLDAKPRNLRERFSWPQVWAECRYISPQSLFYPEGLPAESAEVPDGLDYGSLTVSSTWRLGDLSSPELDFDNPVTGAVVGLFMGAGNMLGSVAGAVGCVFDWVFGDGSACEPDEPDAVPLPEITYFLKFDRFAIQHIRAASDGILFDYLVDSDWDHVLTGLDNCPTVTNYSQTDSDFDGVGDACDPDIHSVSTAEMDAALDYFIGWARIALCMEDLIGAGLPEYVGSDDIFSFFDDPDVIGRFIDIPLAPGLMIDLIRGYLERWLGTYAGGSGPIMEHPEFFIDRHAAYAIAHQQIADLAGRLGRPGLLRLQFATRQDEHGVERMAIVDPTSIMGHLSVPEMLLLRTAAPAVAVRPLNGNVGSPSHAPLPAMENDAVVLGAEPNPFNPQITLRFALPRDGVVEVAIMDVRGRLVRRLASGSMPAGDHEIAWNGDDDLGRHQPSGVYLALVRTEDGQAVRKITMLQ